MIMNLMQVPKFIHYEWGAGKQPQKEMQTVVTTDTLCSSSPGGVFKNREQTFSRTVYIKG